MTHPARSRLILALLGLLAFTLVPSLSAMTDEGRDLLERMRQRTANIPSPSFPDEGHPELQGKPPQIVPPPAVQPTEGISWEVKLGDSKPDSRGKADVAPVLGKTDDGSTTSEAPAPELKQKRRKSRKNQDAAGTPTKPADEPSRAAAKPRKKSPAPDPKPVKLPRTSAPTPTPEPSPAPSPVSIVTPPAPAPIMAPAPVTVVTPSAPVTEVVAPPPAASAAALADAGGTRTFGELSDEELIKFAKEHIWEPQKSKRHNPPPTPPCKPAKKKKTADDKPAASPAKPKKTKTPAKTEEKTIQGSKKSKTTGGK